MKSTRIEAFAELLVGYSCSLEPGEKVLIESIGAPSGFIVELIRAAKRRKATPIVVIKDDEIIRELSFCYEREDFTFLGNVELDLMKQVDAFIGIRAPANICEYSDVPAEKMKFLRRHYLEPVYLRERNERVKWVAVRWPTPGMAERSRMSTQAFEDYYFDICLIDYAALSEAMELLVRRLRTTRSIRIEGPGNTALRFSVSEMPSCKSVGRHNIPDGELLMAPIKDSVEGRICFNVDSTYQGATFREVELEVQGGVVTAATADRPERLNAILEQDSGARSFGEFAFGLHPGITQPINDILIDEKMAGSVHLALGNAYSNCDNGNRSAIHWDLILRQDGESGGGAIYFDNVLVRENGRFVCDDLAPLNPENLLAK